MKRFAILPVVLGGVLAGTQVNAQVSEVVISEYLANPTGSDNGPRTEWIELYNRGNIDVDISGYRVKGNYSSSHEPSATDVTLPSGTIVKAKDYLILAGTKVLFVDQQHRRYHDRDQVVDLGWQRASVINNSQARIAIYPPDSIVPEIFMNKAVAMSSGNDETYEIIDVNGPMNESNYQLSPEVFGRPGRPSSSTNPAGVTITGGQRDIKWPSSSDAVTVAVTVGTDGSSPALSSVDIHIDLGSGFTSHAMTDQGGGNYSYEIPAQPTGTKVKYFVQVNGADGTAITQPKPATPYVYFSDDNFPTGNDLVINEIMYNPQGADNGTNGEWVEIYNSTNRDIDMSFFLWGNHMNTPNNRVLPEGFTIEAKGYAIFAWRISAFLNQYPTVTAPIAEAEWPPDAYTSGYTGSILANTNTNQDLPLVHVNAVDWEPQVVDPNNANNIYEPIDIVPFRVADPWPTSTDGRVIWLNDPTLDNTQGANWTKASANGEETPGAANPGVTRVSDWSVY